ncbi:DUF2716 domain-containing protein [Kitasatospora indigofera]|uniref:DUF2716 domain-containing protein n=1 Tax=Kitasatospora indigofera TaxID=67307 RepID=UPI003683606D
MLDKGGDQVSETAEALLAAYDSQLRGRVPEGVPAGVVVECDGPLVRTHFGTHGIIDHSAFESDGTEELIRRQQRVFAARCEPVEWKIHSTDPPWLAQSLQSAGFAPGPERVVLAANVTDVLPLGPLKPGYRTDSGLRGSWGAGRILNMAASAPEQRRPLAEVLADGLSGPKGSQIATMTLARDGALLDFLWLEWVGGTEFLAIGGITGPRPELLGRAAAFASWWNSGPLFPDRKPRHLVAEASGSLVALYIEAGFHEIARVRTYRWAPPGEPAGDRPVAFPVPEPEGDDIWRRFEAHFDVTYKTADRGIAEPEASAAWHMADIDGPDDPLLAEVEDVIARGIRACARPDDRLYRLKWSVTSSRMDPNRVGRPGQPRWMGYAYLVDEHVIQVTDDLRMGTFGNWREASLCVFGDDLLAQVDQELTDLLGTVLRRAGRPVGNIWSFGP